MNEQKSKAFVLGSLGFCLIDDGDGITMMVRQGSSVWPLFAFKYESAEALAEELLTFIEGAPRAAKS
jgi:hypothetical protein